VNIKNSFCRFYGERFFLRRLFPAFHAPWSLRGDGQERPLAPSGRRTRTPPGPFGAVDKNAPWPLRGNGQERPLAPSGQSPAGGLL
jgi:hypothetical protein